LGIIHSPAQFITSAPTHDLQAGSTALTDDLLRTHLPPQPPTDFIGRRDEINELANAGEDTVMIAVTGVLGIGKTSLLRAAAARLEASPMELFLKLGKPAQEIIVRKDYLVKAVEVYEWAKYSIAEMIREEREAEEERLREARERRAAPDYVRLILGTTRKRVRGLDKNQCVFCGAEVGERHGKYAYVRLTPKGYKADEVVLSCKPCEAKLEGRTPTEAGMTMEFGRFNKGPLTARTLPSLVRPPHPQSSWCRPRWCSVPLLAGCGELRNASARSTSLS
jgi:hypothetical protein